jgi:hypothetical protein
MSSDADADADAINDLHRACDAEIYPYLLAEPARAFADLVPFVRTHARVHFRCDLGALVRQPHPARALTPIVRSAAAAFDAEAARAYTDPQSPIHRVSLEKSANGGALMRALLFYPFSLLMRLETTPTPECRAETRQDLAHYAAFGRYLLWSEFERVRRDPVYAAVLARVSAAVAPAPETRGQFQSPPFQAPPAPPATPKDVNK